MNLLSDLGVWGAGFHKSIDRTFGPAVREELADRYKQRGMPLGTVWLHRVAPDTRLATFVAVRGLRSPFCDTPLDYPSLRLAMERLIEVLPREGVEFHGPRLGKSPQNADWSIVSKIIEEVIVSRGFEVTIYDLKENTHVVGSAGRHL